MTIKPKRFLMCSTVLVMLAGFSATLYGQAAQEEKRVATVTGCLTKGSGTGQFMLAEEKTGQQLPVTGPAELEKHAANHTVRLTGSVVKEGGQEVFKVTKIEHVSASCSSAK